MSRWSSTSTLNATDDGPPKYGYERRSSRPYASDNTLSEKQSIRVVQSTLSSFDNDTAICERSIACRNQAPLRSIILQIYSDVSTDISDKVDTNNQDVRTNADWFKKPTPDWKYGRTIWAGDTKTGYSFRWIFEEGTVKDSTFESFYSILRIDNPSPGCDLFACFRESKPELIIPITRVCIPKSGKASNEDIVKDALQKYLTDLADHCNTCSKIFQDLGSDSLGYE